MSEKLIKDYINYQKSIVSIKIMWQIFLLAIIFLALDVIVSIIMKLNAEIFLLCFMVLLTFIFLIYTTFSRQGYDKLILGYAMTFSSVALSCAFFSYAVLVSFIEVSPFYLLMEVLVYVISSVVNIIIVRRLIKKDNYFSNTKKAVVPFCTGMIGGMIGVVFAKIFTGNLGYNLIAIITAVIFFVICLYFSISSHLYYCYYLMKKYDKEEI